MNLKKIIYTTAFSISAVVLSAATVDYNNSTYEFIEWDSKTSGSNSLGAATVQGSGRDAFLDKGGVVTNDFSASEAGDYAVDGVSMARFDGAASRNPYADTITVGLPEPVSSVLFYVGGSEQNEHRISLGILDFSANEGIQITQLFFDGAEKKRSFVGENGDTIEMESYNNKNTRQTGGVWLFEFDQPVTEFSWSNISQRDAGKIDRSAFGLALEQAPSVSPVPVPASGLLALSAIGGLALMRRRKKA